MNNLGKNIKSLRQAHNWSQEDIAQQLGITAPAFSKIECGFTDINYSRLEQISALFGLSPVELITYHNQEEQKKHFDEIQLLRLKLADREAQIIELQNKVISLLEGNKVLV